MNYSLVISLEGAKEAEQSIDRLLKKMGQLDSMSMDNLIDQSGILKESEDVGQKAGKKLGESVAKGAKSVDMRKLLFAGIATLYNPFVGARLLSDVVPKGATSSSFGGGMTGAIFGAAGSAGYGEIFVVIKTLQLAFKALMYTVKQVTQAYEDARKSFAKAMTSGLGLGFTIKRSMVADVLGVSETDAVRFGHTWEIVNEKLEFASTQLSNSAAQLASVGWEFKILGQNTKALWSEIAQGLAPAMQSLSANFNDFLVTIGKSDVLGGLSRELGAVLIVLSDVIGLVEVAIGGLVTGFKVIADSITIFIMKMLNLIAKIPGAGKLGGWDTSEVAKDLIDVTTQLANQAQHVWDNKFGGKPSATTGPETFMKQLPTSTWEKMGLVLGNNPAMNYARDTAKNTGKLVSMFEKIVKNNGEIPRSGTFDPLQAMP